MSVLGEIFAEKEGKELKVRFASAVLAVDVGKGQEVVGL